MKRPTTIDPVRLFKAADHLLKALESMNGSGTLISMATGTAYRDELLAADTYRQEELIEAMDMLIRMGFVRAEQHSG